MDEVIDNSTCPSRMCHDSYVYIGADSDGLGHHCTRTGLPDLIFWSLMLVCRGCASVARWDSQSFEGSPCHSRSWVRIISHKHFHLPSFGLTHAICAGFIRHGFARADACCPRQRSLPNTGPCHDPRTTACHQRDSVWRVALCAKANR